MAVGVGVREFILPRIDRRMVIGGVLAAVAVIGVLRLTEPPERFPVLVAGSNLEVGVPLGEMDVDIRYVESAEGLVEGDSVGGLAEWSLTTPLSEGEPILVSLVQPPEQVISPNVIALSLPAENAVLGRLAAGDYVDIYVTNTGTFESEGETYLLASSVYIVEVVVSESTIDAGDVSILLAVDDTLASQLASVLHTGEIDLVRVTE